MAKEGIKAELAGLGLSPAESEVYLELLKQGEALASGLAGNVGNSRTHVYDTLESLMKKALVSYVLQNGRRYYKAAAPQRLVDYIIERESELERQKERISAILPELLKLGPATGKPRVEILEGRAGYKAILRDIIETGMDFEVMNASDSLHEQFEIPLQQFYRDRKAAKIKSRMVYRIDSKPIKSLLDKVQFAPIESKNPSPTYIYGGKVAILLDLEELIVLKIESKEYAQSQREEFELIWNRETVVMHGLDAIQYVFEDMLKVGYCDWIGARGYFFEKRPEYVIEWAERAAKSGFRIRNIVDPDVRGHPITELPFAKTRYTLKKEFMMFSVFWIYGGKVVISNWAGKEPVVFIIENKDIYNTYKQQFEFLWGGAAPGIA